MNRRNENGVALVITLFLMASLSALAVSLMFLSQTETSASRNYKTMSQARYAGEAGVHKAMNYLMSDTFKNTLPATYASLATNTYPVQFNGADVTLSATAASSNYPSTAVKDAFAGLFSGSNGQLAAGTATLGYAATAKLLSVQPLTVYGGGTGYVLTWQINATGTVSGPMPATVEVTAILERDTAPAQTYAIFATGNGCGAINLGGTSHTDSYNSSTMTTTPPTMTNSGGGVGTNGNLSISGHVTVNGNLDTPRTGVGACNAGTPTALSSGGTATVSGSIVQLPQAREYPLPEAPVSPYIPNTNPQTITASITSCTAIVAANLGAGCVANGATKTITVTSNGSTPLVFNNLTISSQQKLVLQYGGTPPPGTTVGTVNVNVNSVTLAAQAEINLGTNTAVAMNVQGTGSTTPFDISGGAFTNTSYDPSRFQVLYAGTGQIELIGGNAAAISVYAPRASVRLNGNADIYGSVLCGTYTNAGNGSVHYDTALQTKFFTLGNFVMSSFSWKKY